MMTAFELLNKVKWDKKENPAEYTLAYHDRIKNTNVELPLSEVVAIDQLAFTIRKGKDDVEIPLHRLRKIYKRGLLLWDREKKE